MTIDEIEQINRRLNRVLDLNECETDFEIIDVFETFTSSSEHFTIGLQRQYTLRKYQLFITGEHWELYDDNDFGENPMNFTPLLEGDISTLKYREK